MNDKAELTDWCDEKKAYVQPKIVKLGESSDTENAFNFNADGTILSQS